MGGHDEHGSHSKPSISDEEIRRLLARAETQVFSEAPKYSADAHSGVLPMSLTGRFHKERARLGPDFTEAERQWRIKWLQQQSLQPSEPFYVPQVLTSNLNPFRRFYRKPLDYFENAVAKFTRYRENATIIRKIVGRSFIGYFTILFVWYQLNYNTASWEKARGIRVHHTKEVVLPGDIRYPMPNPRTESWQHYDRGFHDRKVFLGQQES